MGGLSGIRPTRERLTLSAGTELAYLRAGDPAGSPSLLLLHGFPNSSRGFRDVIPLLARDAHVIVPDLPGFGESDPLATPSFAAFADAIRELLAHLAIGPRLLYVHDFGAPVAFDLAMAEPDLVLGLVIQNANAHPTGWGPGWEATRAYWAAPDEHNTAAAMAHLTLEGTRAQYDSGLPDDVASALDPAQWAEDWRVMSRPGNMRTQRALIADYGRYAQRLDAIGAYLREWQPPAVMVWGRHDAFFDIAETLSWMEDLPRMQAHILDGGHLLLETHAEQAAPLIADFVRGVAMRR
ncbi:alpha/beta fold hydrolase [Microbacterium timonense]|uniref:alpha/beta fold hydrolase n=1 Tax=Microbacterium timonense TaxID=2086576 RepID=UPI000D105E2E|nr:alpha/beta hydrolase [Microbacterium timonense]